VSVALWKLKSVLQILQLNPSKVGLLCVKKLKFTEELANKTYALLLKIYATKKLCSSTSPCVFNMAAYRADQQQEYGVQNWNNVNAAVL